jgi:hypothetical protein
MKRIYNPDLQGDLTAEEYLAQDPLGMKKASMLPSLNELEQDQLDEQSLAKEFEEEQPDPQQSEVALQSLPKEFDPAPSRFPSLSSISERPVKLAQMGNEEALGQALEQARKNEQSNNLMKATNALLGARGLYSGKATDMSPYNEVLDSSTKLGLSKAQDLQTKEKFGQDIITGKSAKNKFEQTTKEQDPTSDTSKTFRKAIEKVAPWILSHYGSDWENVAASDKNDIWDIIKTKEQMDLRRQMAKESADSKKELQAEKNAFKKESQPASAGIKKLDTEFAKDYNEWTGGGKESFEKNLQRLKDAKVKLAASGAGGRFAGRLPDWLKSEELITTRDDVHAAAVAGLRAALGAQFTEKEGERIQGYSFNEKLSPEENAKKIDAAIKELEQSKLQKEAKARYFEQNETLKGYTPEKFSENQEPAPNEETRLTKDGKRAIFNKDTKKFIRWAE